MLVFGGVYKEPIFRTLSPSGLPPADFFIEVFGPITDNAGGIVTWRFWSYSTKPAKLFQTKQITGCLEGNCGIVAWLRL